MRQQCEKHRHFTSFLDLCGIKEKALPYLRVNSVQNAFLDALENSFPLHDKTYPYTSCEDMALREVICQRLFSLKGEE